MVELLSRDPTGHALVPSGLGNVLPAFSAHRAWLGHWFPTPESCGRQQELLRLTTRPALAESLRPLLREQEIRYLVMPRGRAAFVARQLGDAAVTERRRVGSLELPVLEAPLP